MFQVQRTIWPLVLALGLAPAAHGDPVALDIDGNRATAEISLTGGIGVDLTIEFDQVIGLTSAALGVEAELVTVTDPTLLARLPSGLVNPVGAFPVMITVEPPVNSGLTLSGLVEVELHTHNLTLVTNTPLRLFKAPLGGEFRDITDNIGAGSIRSRGRTGGFSQFMILADLRSHDAVAADKLADLDAELGAASLSSTDRSALQAYVDAADADLDAGLYLDAADHIDEFIDAVDGLAGAGIANVWRASRDVHNSAGELIGQASSLRFSLRMANSLL